MRGDHITMFILQWGRVGVYQFPSLHCYMLFLSSLWASVSPFIHQRNWARIPRGSQLSVLCDPVWLIKEKRNNRFKMELYAPITTNQDLIATSGFSRNVSFKQPIWNFRNSISEVICRTKPLLFPSPQKRTWPETIFSFVMTSLFHPLSAYKTLPFGTATWSTSLFPRWEAAGIVQ